MVAIIIEIRRDTCIGGVTITGTISTDHMLEKVIIVTGNIMTGRKATETIIENTSAGNIAKVVSKVVNRHECDYDF